MKIEPGMKIVYDDTEMIIAPSMIAHGTFECVVCGERTDTVLFMYEEFYWICSYGHESKVGFGKRE